MLERLREKYFRNVNITSAVLLLVVYAWLVVLFHLLGNTTDVRLFSRSVLQWMVSRWSDATFNIGEYSHGWLIPLVSLFALWRKRDELLAAPKAAFWPAIGLVGFGLLLHWVGARVQQPRVSLMSLVFLLWAIPFFLYGRCVAKLLVFPCFYLVFCIPLNFFDTFSFDLRIVSTVVSTWLLNGLGIEVVRSGSAIHAASGAFNLEVADACSGIRSLLALTALTAAYAYFTQRVFWKQTVLFVSAIPLAVIGNMARVTSIGVVAQGLGQDTALRYYHDYSAYVVFVVAVLLLTAFEGFLSRRFRSSIRSS
jgi:exosortase